MRACEALSPKMQHKTLDFAFPSEATRRTVSTEGPIRMLSNVAAWLDRRFGEQFRLGLNAILTD